MSVLQATRGESIAIERWTVRPVGDLVACPAQLRERVFDLGPSGTVHEALIREGVIPHPDEPGGEDAQEWIGRTDWCFAAWIRVPHAAFRRRRLDLVLEHVDTLGDVRVNGVRVASVANEFVPHRIPSRAFLREGVNEIEIVLRGPVSAVEELERRLGTRPVNGDWTPFSFLRKSACNFGWDWGPRVPTVGIGLARIEAWSGARIHAVRPLVTRCDEAAATVEVHVDVERADDEPIAVRVEITAPNGRIIEAIAPCEGESAVVEVAIAAPERWWPRGHGEQPLYRVRTLLERACEALDEDVRRIGLRTVAIDTSEDDLGSRFTVVVNGVAVWCRGANWIPVDVFPRSASDERVRAWIDAACDANLNMLRVWGGGIYERAAFYDRCDERGVLVWQDFMFACATYPEDAPYPALIEAEARHQVARLASHPSVALWCGGNEDILAWWSWGWRERLAEGQGWGRRYWLELLPRIVAEVDPTRRYWPESPYSGSMDVHPNDPARGDRHTWDAKLEAYREIVPRFCSEFGHQSPPSIGTLAERVPNELLELGSEELAHRQRAWGGDAFQYAPLLAERFPTPASLDDWILAAQLLQARAYELAIGWWRANAPRCMGALFWQWNDVWRGHSWSVWDVAGRPKPAYFAVRRACAAVHLSFHPFDGQLSVVCSSAAGEGAARPESVRLRAISGEGTTLDEIAIDLDKATPWRAVAALPDSWLDSFGPRASLLVADASGFRAAHRLRSDREDPLPAPCFSVTTREGGVSIRAETLLSELCVLPECAQVVDSRVDDGMLTLLPGEVADVRVTGRSMTADEARRAIRCANHVGRLIADRHVT